MRRKLVVIVVYKDLFGGIFGKRVPSDGIQYVVHTWSSDVIYLIQTNFPQNHVNYHCEWPDIVSEARVETLFLEIGKKLTSVDQKVVTVMMR